MEHLTTLNPPIDPSKPSLFELLSSTQLESLIPPSLRYLLAVATHRHPRYLLRILNSFDELYALSMLLVERYYLRTYSAGFVENFYGIKREKVLNYDIPRASRAAGSIARDVGKLGRGDVWKNLTVMVGVPYLKRKIDESYEINAPRALLGVAYTQLPENPTFRQRVEHFWRWFLRRIWPSLNAIYYASILVCNLAYLMGGTKYHSPFMWLVGTRMRRLGEADMRAFAAMDAPKPTQGASGAGTQGMGSFFSPRTLGARAADGLKVLLPTSIFALKFLEWWHASDFARQLSRKATEGLEVPPPLVSGLPQRKTPTHTKSQAIAKSQKEKDDGESEEEKRIVTESPPIAGKSLLPILTVAKSEDSANCPICDEEVQTATACQTGFVFCYVCIHRWVEGVHEVQERWMKGREGKWESGAGRCAVTGRRVLGGTEGLRRVMV